MNPTEMKNRKDQLTEEISQAVMSFQKDTGLAVGSVIARTVEVTEVGGPKINVVCSVDVQVAI